MTSLLERPSFIESVEVQGNDVLLKIVLYDYLDLPPVTQPVLWIRLQECRELSSDIVPISSLRDKTVWEIEYSESGQGVSLSFEDDVQQFARLSCRSIEMTRAEFQISDYERIIAKLLEIWRHAQKDLATLHGAIRSHGSEIEVELVKKERILRSSLAGEVHRAESQGAVAALRKVLIGMVAIGFNSTLPQIK